MALFRKPKKPIRPRVITINDEAEDDEMDDSPIIEPPPPSVPIDPPVEVHRNGNSSKSDLTAKISSSVEFKSRSISKNKESIVTDRKQTLLSFDEELEGDDGEVFKVKKSSVSRRLIRQRDKEKKSDVIEINLGDTKMSTSSEYNKIKAEGEEFIRILNGREAEAVHLEEEDNLDDDADDSSLQVSVKFRSTAQRDAASEAVRMALERGEIPDAKLIHEARKRRMMARQFNTGAPEFIPVADNTQRYRAPQSRLVRDDDDNDRSGEEDEERMNFSTATNAAKLDREKRREAFDAAQQQEEERGHNSSEIDSDDHEEEEWEKQQIRKGVTQSQMQSVVKEALQQQPFGYSVATAESAGANFIDLTLNVYPSFPSPGGTNAIGLKKPSVKTRSLNMQDIMGGKAKISVDMIISTLSDRLNKFTMNNESQEGELSRMEAELNLLEEELEDAKTAKPALSSRYILYQNLRGYVLDLVDCLRCKVPAIESLELKMLELMESRAKRIASRRREDMKDQLEEVKATSTILSGGPVTVAPPSMNEVKSRRAAEREGRRTRRRRLREIKNYKGHKEGLSSDDEETELEVNAYKIQRDAIIQEAVEIFEDVVDDFGSVGGVLSRFEEWRKHDFDAYKESFAYMCVPKCLAPLLRAKLLCWDPFMDGFNMVKFDWIKPLVLYGSSGDGSSDTLQGDPDSRLIPEVAEKILIPWITKVVKAKWDPLSASQTKILVNVTRRCIDEWTVVSTSKNIQLLLATVVDKFKEAVDSDVYIPLFPKAQMLNKCSPAYVFASRQFWSSVKLLDNMSSWAGLLNDRPLHILALDALLTRYILLGLRTAPDVCDSVDRAKGVVNVLPRTWLIREADKEVPNGLMQLTACLVSIVQNTDFAVAANRVAISEVGNVLKSIGAVHEAQLVLQKYS